MSSPSGMFHEEEEGQEEEEPTLDQPLFPELREHNIKWVILAHKFAFYLCLHGLDSTLARKLLPRERINIPASRSGHIIFLKLKEVVLWPNPTSNFPTPPAMEYFTALILEVAGLYFIHYI